MSEAGVRVVVRKIEAADVALIQLACLDRVARYKLKGVWLSSFNQFPLPGHHTEKVCVEIENNALFTQISYHWQESEQEKYVIPLNEGLAVIKRQGAGFKYALIFISQNLSGRVPFVFEFAAASLRATGSWMLESIEPTEFYSEASAFTL